MIAIAAFSLALVVAAVLVNAFLVNGESRAAIPRSGGSIVNTRVVPANVLVEGDGPAIVLIHGFGAALDWWDAIAETLAKDYRVIRLDLIGHGGTEAPNRGYAIERQAALVNAVLDAYDAGRVIVIGHSMGGEVATALAEARPERIEKLVLIDTPSAAATTFDRTTRLYMVPVIGPLLSRLVTHPARRRALAQGFAPGFAVPERFVADLAQLPYPAAVAAHNASVTYRTAQTIPRRLAELDRVPPLHVIFGALDAIVPASEGDRYDAVPGATTVVLNGVGHSPMVEAPKETLALIRDFLGAGEPSVPPQSPP